MPGTAPALRLPLVPWSTCVWLCLACSPSDEGATADGGAAAGGAPTGGASSRVDAGAGGANVADAEVPEVAAWQVLELSALGRVRDVVAIDVGAALATDRGLFRLTPDGVAAFITPEVPGGYAAVDFTPTSGLYAIGADGATLALGAPQGPLGAVDFRTSVPYVEVVASHAQFFGLRAADRVAFYENQPGVGAAPITGATGPATAVVAEGPQHLVALPETIFALDAMAGTPQALPDGSLLEGVTTLHLTEAGEVFGGDAMGRLVERVGGVWQRTPAPAPGVLRGGDVGPDGVVLVGDAGLVLRRSGGAWAQLDLPRTDDLVDAAATPGMPLLLTAAGDVLWYGLPSQAPSFEAPEPIGADAGTPDPVLPDAGPPVLQPQLRVISLNDGAVVDGCLDRRPFEGPYDRVGNQGGQTASGYAPISQGPHRFQTDVYFLADNRCRDIGEDAEFTARPNKLYTALIWELLGFSSVEVWSSDVPPTDGATRVRATGHSEARSGRLAVCLDGQPLPGDFGVVDRTSFTAEVRVWSDVPCQGELLGTAAVELAPGSANTLVAYSLGQRDEAPHALITCLDVDADGALANGGLCRDVALTAP